ncbi:MAG: PucR family transcriptional regulator [Coriobacteriales bacterium]
MKLNAAIVFDGLPLSFGATISGYRSDKLSLERPELLEGNMMLLKSNHLYVISEGSSSKHFDVEKGAVVICVGDTGRLSRFESSCCVIAIHAAIGLSTVFNNVQSTFNRFDKWEETLRSLLDESDGIQEMLEVSQAVLPGSLFALDSNFHYLGYSNPSGIPADQTPDEYGNLGIDELSKFLSSKDLSMYVDESFPIEIEGMRSLNVNLLDNGAYRGCLTLVYEGVEPRPGDGPLLEVLATYVLRAEKELFRSNAVGGSIRQILGSLIEGISPDAHDRDALRNLSSGKNFICMKLLLPQRISAIPVRYACGTVERVFDTCWAFEGRPGFMVAVADVGEIDQNCLLPFLEQSLVPVIKQFGIAVGVSDIFGNLENLQPYYAEAGEALDLGLASSSKKTVHIFDDYRLEELVSNAMGEFPLEILLTPELRDLIEHDRTAYVSYVDTLRCYLDNGMSATATARELYISRSSLLERIDRIERILGTSLEDPDERLLYQILLKAIEEESRFAGRK